MGAALAFLANPPYWLFHIVAFTFGLRGASPWHCEITGLTHRARYGLGRRPASTILAVLCNRLDLPLMISQ